MLLGVGVDIQATKQMQRTIQRSGETFIKKVFLEQEILYCQKQKKDLQHFVARFCAKEAFLKALGTGWNQGISWLDIEVVKKKSGAPEINLKGQA